MSERVYLDWNATAPLRPEARAAMVAALDIVGNPSSVHSEGRAARRVVETAREQVAGLVGARPQDVIFTSGGTEANALALNPGLFGGGHTRLIVSAGEHASVLCGGRFGEGSVERIALTRTGLVDLDALAACVARLKQNATPFLASVMHANNETGVIQPVTEVAGIVHEAGGLLHVDAVQSAGRIDCNISALQADLLSVSSHKLGGPKGAGALVLRAGVELGAPLIRGGGQERGRRAGTENVAAIAGFGAAVATSSIAANDQLLALRRRLESALAAWPVTIFGAEAPRLPNTTLVAIAGLKAETALIALDLDGIAVSSGAACSSGKVAASHVLAGMGVPAELALGAIRVSLGYSTTEQDIDSFLRAWTRLVATLSKGRDLAA